MIVDFHRSQPKHAPLCISNCEVEKVENIKFLGVQISDNLSWSNNTTGLVKRAQQRLYFLRKLQQAAEQLLASGCQGAQHTSVLDLLTGLTGLAHITLNHF